MYVKLNIKFYFSDSSKSTLEAAQAKREFFTESTVKEICQRLISKYLPLTQEDLALWDADGEDYGKSDLDLGRGLGRDRDRP